MKWKFLQSFNTNFLQPEFACHASREIQDFCDGMLVWVTNLVTLTCCQSIVALNESLQASWWFTKAFFFAMMSLKGVNHTDKQTKAKPQNALNNAFQESLHESLQNNMKVILVTALNSCKYTCNNMESIY